LTLVYSYDLVFHVLQEGIRILQPFLVGEMVAYLEPGSTMSRLRVYVCATILGLSGFVYLVVNPLYFVQGHKIAMQMRAAVSGLIYRKVSGIYEQERHPIILM
jgi:ATP-binding cassette subfamily C (CFTR/MRP) protein 4